MGATGSGRGGFPFLRGGVMRKGASSLGLGRVLLGMPSVYPAGRPGQSAGSGWFLLVGRKRLSRSGLTRRMGVKPPVTTPIFDPLDFGHGLATPREGARAPSPGAPALAEESRTSSPRSRWPGASRTHTWGSTGTWELPWPHPRGHFRRGPWESSKPFLPKKRTSWPRSSMSPWPSFPTRRRRRWP